MKYRPQTRDEDEFGCCIDNDRFACTESKEEMMDYNIQKEEGCCGSYDNEVVCPIDGKTYWVGFNYGH